MPHTICTCLWFRDGLGREADPAVRAKAMAAMMKQKKIDLAAIEAAVRA